MTSNARSNISKCTALCVFTVWVYVSLHICVPVCVATSMCVFSCVPVCVWTCVCVCVCVCVWELSCQMCLSVCTCRLHMCEIWLLSHGSRWDVFVGECVLSGAQSANQLDPSPPLHNNKALCVYIRISHSLCVFIYQCEHTHTHTHTCTNTHTHTDTQTNVWMLVCVCVWGRHFWHLLFGPCQ